MREQNTEAVGKSSVVWENLEQWVRGRIQGYLRTDAAKRFKKVDNATALIWKIMMVAETTFRRLNAADLLKNVYQRAKYADGIGIQEDSVREAA